MPPYNSEDYRIDLSSDLESLEARLTALESGGGGETSVFWSVEPPSGWGSIIPTLTYVDICDSPDDWTTNIVGTAYSATDKFVTIPSTSRYFIHAQVSLYSMSTRLAEAVLDLFDITNNVVLARTTWGHRSVALDERQQWLPLYVAYDGEIQANTQLKLRVFTFFDDDDGAVTNDIRVLQQMPRQSYFSGYSI